MLVAITIHDGVGDRIKMAAKEGERDHGKVK